MVTDITTLAVCDLASSRMMGWMRPLFRLPMCFSVLKLLQGQLFLQGAAGGVCWVPL